MSNFRALAFIILTALIATATSVSAQTTLKVDGSTGAMPLIAALAKVYQAKTPSVRIETGKGLGTRARIDALNTGSIDIAVASHGLRMEELVKQGLVVDEIARTPVVLGVNASVPVTNISQAQVCEIYSGNLSNWNAAGGPDLTVAARTRPDSEVDTEVVRDEIACLKVLKMPDAVKVMPSSGDMANELATTAGSIGMTTMTVVEQSGDKIKVLWLDGVAPTEANVVAGKYRLIREVFLVAKASASLETKAFIAFIKSADGAKIIKANGAIPKVGN